MTSVNSPVLSPTSFRLLEEDQPPSTSFSDTLVSLGFAQAKSQKFEWLTSFPTARPLLTAIQIHFTPECVLTPQQALQYASIKQNQSLLPDSELFDVAKLLLPPVPSCSDVQQQRQQHLETARQRLALLRVQRDLLREELSLQRQSRQVRKSLPSSARRKSVSNVIGIQRLQDGLDRLRTCLRLNPCSLNMDTSIDVYFQRECHLFGEMLNFARQNFQMQRLTKPYAPTAPGTLSLRQIVKSYAEIKAQHCIQEARLLRANAMLAILDMHKQSPRKQLASVSLHALIKDLRAKGKNALDMKVRLISEKAEEQLWERIQMVLLTDTLRRQNHIIETARFFAKICLEQRVRALCFSLATSAQEDRYHQLFDILRRLAATASHDCTSRGGDMRTGLSATPVDFTELHRRLLSPADVLVPLKSFSEIEAFEREVFDSGIQTLSKKLEDFINEIGREGSWLRLDSHPRYDVLVNELGKLLNHNTAILEAVLRKRELHGGAAIQSRAWIDIVNSHP